MLTHPFDCIYDNNSRILILGTFPSVKSREVEFYYGHPQNRFWKVLAFLYKVNKPESIEDKKKFLLSYNIALWDVIKKCDIKQSADASINNVTVNDIGGLLLKAPVTKIFCNGSKAFELYNKYLLPDVKIEAIKLPSTSSANASWSFEKLVDAWSVIL